MPWKPRQIYHRNIGGSCAIGCIAMLLNRDQDELFAAFAHVPLVSLDEATSTGIDLDRACYMIEAGGWRVSLEHGMRDWAEAYLCSVGGLPSSTHPDHGVVITPDGTVYDPNHYRPRALEDYPIKGEMRALRRKERP